MRVGGGLAWRRGWGEGGEKGSEEAWPARLISEATCYCDGFYPVS
jgi:hypothetical protein